MSDNQIIRFIRQTPSLNRLWDKMTGDERRKVMFIANGDSWRLSEIFEFVLDQRTETINA